MSVTNESQKLERKILTGDNGNVHKNSFHSKVAPSKVSFLKEYIDLTNGVIAGGVFRTIFSEDYEFIKDIDIFFEAQNDLDCAIENLSKNSERFTLISKSETVKYYDNKNRVLIELILTKTRVEHFDFSVCMCSLYKDFDGVYRLRYHTNFMEDLKNKVLRIMNLPNPMRTFNRMFRYMEYGFKPDLQSKFELYQALSKNENDCVKHNDHEFKFESGEFYSI